MSEGPRPTDDLLGYDLNEVTPDFVTVALPERMEAEVLRVREHDGGSPPLLRLERVRDAYAELRLRPSSYHLFDSSLHVQLDMRNPWVQGRGHVNLIRTWHVWCDVPRADWLSWLDVDGTGGIIELWLHDLTPGAEYILDVKVTGAWRSGSSAFKVGSSANFWANYPVPSSYQAQHLMGVLQPNDAAALVRIEPVDLNSVSFHQAKIRKV